MQKFHDFVKKYCDLPEGWGDIVRRTFAGALAEKFEKPFKVRIKTPSRWLRDPNSILKKWMDNYPKKVNDFLPYLLNHEDDPEVSSLIELARSQCKEEILNAAIDFKILIGWDGTPENLVKKLHEHGIIKEEWETQICIGNNFFTDDLNKRDDKIIINTGFGLIAADEKGNVICIEDKWEEAEFIPLKFDFEEYVEFYDRKPLSKENVERSCLGYIATDGKIHYPSFDARITINANIQEKFTTTLYARMMMIQFEASLNKRYNLPFKAVIHPKVSFEDGDDYISAIGSLWHSMTSRNDRYFNRSRNFECTMFFDEYFNENIMLKKDDDDETVSLNYGLNGNIIKIGEISYDDFLHKAKFGNAIDGIGKKIMDAKENILNNQGMAEEKKKAEKPKRPKP